MTQVYDELVDFIAKASTPREVIEFQPSPATKERVFQLLRRDKSSTGLEPEEKQELERFLVLEHLLRLAKAKARERLAQAYRHI